MRKHKGQINAKTPTSMKTPTPVRSIPARVADSGKVRLGMVAPVISPVRAVPAKVVDSGKVRLGMVAPVI